MSLPLDTYLGMMDYNVVIVPSKYNQNLMK